MSKFSGQFLISGQFQDICEISGISGQLGALKLARATWSKVQRACLYRPCRDLGLFPDSELSMKQHIATVAAICYYHVRRTRKIRRPRSDDSSRPRVWTTATQHWLICFSRLLYCSAATLQNIAR